MSATSSCIFLDKLSIFLTLKPPGRCIFDRKRKNVIFALILIVFNIQFIFFNAYFISVLEHLILSPLKYL